jgi:hypothetical protein
MFSRYSDPTDWTFDIPTARQAAAWQHSRTHATDWARWNAYLNQLCLDTCLAEFQAGPLPRVTAPEPLAPSWAVVNGSVLTAQGTRFVLIPTEAVDYTEMAVPQEWVDIPSWAGDYYLAVQVAADGQSLQVVGYASHGQVKQYGTYSSGDRTYSLDLDDLTADLNLLWVSQARYAPAPRSNIAPLPVLSAAQVTNLITRLGNPLELLPRLEVPFTTWAALLNHPSHCQQLYAHRQGLAAGPSITQLGQWFQGQIAATWQTVESLLPAPQVGFATRNVPTAPEDGSLSRAKLLSLDTGSIVLQLTLTPLTAPEMRVHAQILPVGGSATLPGETRLRLLTDGPDGRVEIGQAQAAITETIQLQFRALPEETFELEITCNGETLRERFAL